MEVRVSAAKQLDARIFLHGESGNGDPLKRAQRAGSVHDCGRRDDRNARYVGERGDHLRAVCRVQRDGRAHDWRGDYSGGENVGIRIDICRREIRLKRCDAQDRGRGDGKWRRVNRAGAFSRLRAVGGVANRRACGRRGDGYRLRRAVETTLYAEARVGHDSIEPRAVCRAGRRGLEILRRACSREPVGHPVVLFREKRSRRIVGGELLHERSAGRGESEVFAGGRE